MISSRGDNQEGDESSMELELGRILYDIPCRVCQDNSSGKHYGIFACDGCAGFFKRSVRRQRVYVCKAKEEGACLVDKTHRNQCRACRLKKCMDVGMNSDAVQHERGPRTSTLRRQMAIYIQEHGTSPPVLQPEPRIHSRTPPVTSSPIVDTVLPIVPGSSGFSPFTPFLFNPFAIFCPLSSAIQSPSIDVMRVPDNAIQTVCEAAAKLLLMNPTWAKSVPEFTALKLEEQLLLLESSWGQLFVLGAAQFQLPIHLLRAEAARRGEQISRYLEIFQEIILKFQRLHLDTLEYSYLRSIALFDTTFDDSSEASSRRLESPTAVAAVQKHFELALTNYLKNTKPLEPLRLSECLMLLPELKKIPPSVIQDIFFSSSIGHIPIEVIISDVYKKKDNPDSL